MKRNVLAFLSACMILLISGCTSLSEVEKLQEIISSKSASAGVIYLGYIDDIQQVDEYLNELALLDEYEELKDYDDDQIILSQGNEIYCLIPSEDVLSVKVSEFKLDEEDYSGKPGRLLYESYDADFIYLIGNISDIMPSFIVEMVNKQGEVIQYSPSLSLKDGSLNISEDGSILDLDYLFRK